MSGLSEFDVALPRKRMAAGVLLFDQAGRLLVVEPVYKSHWEIPGGAVELNESPRAAARREMDEELGIDRAPGALLGVDWVAPRPERSEGLITVFDGGVLEHTEIDRIRLPPEELSSWAFVDAVRAQELLPPLLARRLAACLTARGQGQTVYLENGFPI
jgi:8-oxo-dGTP pyrophosphatase MutT (NUDIX family)